MDLKNSLIRKRLSSLNLSKKEKVEEKSVLKDVTEEDVLDIVKLAHETIDHAEEVVKNLIQGGWKVCHFSMLPSWLQDNDFLKYGHRPPLPSFRTCFRSIFRLHTETGNIWTHMIGFIMFVCITMYFLIHPYHNAQEKILFGIYFAGAIICLGFSFIFHTVCCHSAQVTKIFSRLDYCGISFLITSSSVLWLYYGFYCNFQLKLIYLIWIISLGVTTILISLLDKFYEPEWRTVRAVLFISFGLSNVVPAIQFGIVEGWFNPVFQTSFGWLVLMACLYIAGAALYAIRIPERFAPGKFDIWFHSHQILHISVIVAALVHPIGVLELANHRLTIEKCDIMNSSLY